jgi:hypothetical protein
LGSVVWKRHSTTPPRRANGCGWGRPYPPLPEEVVPHPFCKKAGHMARSLFFLNDGPCHWCRRPTLPLVGSPRNRETAASRRQAPVDRQLRNLHRSNRTPPQDGQLMRFCSIGRYATGPLPESPLKVIQLTVYPAKLSSSSTLQALHRDKNHLCPGCAPL